MITPSNPGDPDLLDDDTVDRILDGAVAGPDAPPGFGAVADLVHALRADARPHEIVDDDEREIVAAFRDGGVIVILDERRSRRSRAAIAGLVVAGSLLVSGAAAAMGALPDTAQGIVHDVLGQVGVGVPDRETPADPTVPTSTTVTAIPGSTGSVVSGIARDPGSTGVDKGAAVCAQVSAERCRAGVAPGADAPSTALNVTPSVVPSTPGPSVPPATATVPTVPPTGERRTPPTDPPTSVPGTGPVGHAVPSTTVPAATPAEPLSSGARPL